MESASHYVGSGEPFEEVPILIRYGHPSGAVQAVHPETGTKQVGGTPAEAVTELFQLLRGGRQLPSISTAVCPCGDYTTKETLELAVEWGELHEAECGEGEVHVEEVIP